MDVEIRKSEPIRLVGIRHVGPYWRIGEAFERLHGWMAAAGHTFGPGYALYHDDPGSTPEAEQRSDACVQVAEGFTPEDPAVAVHEIPAGEYAVATYVGGYEGLPEAWGRLFAELLPATGRASSPGVSFEVYIDNCNELPKERLRTELWVPVTDRRGR